MKRRSLHKRYGHAGHPLFPRIHIVISRDVSPARLATGEKFAIEGRIQRHYGGDWALIALRFAKTGAEAGRVAREISASVTKEYKPGSPAEISHGARAFGDYTDEGGKMVARARKLIRRNA
jgi:hypothetical protein